jgi:hypothetical protein
MSPSWEQSYALGFLRNCRLISSSYIFSVSASNFHRRASPPKGRLEPCSGAKLRGHRDFPKWEHFFFSRFLRSDRVLVFYFGFSVEFHAKMPTGKPGSRSRATLRGGQETTGAVEGVVQWKAKVASRLAVMSADAERRRLVGSKGPRNHTSGPKGSPGSRSWGKLCENEERKESDAPT